MPRGDLQKEVLQPEAIRDLTDREIQARLDKYREDLFRHRLDLSARKLKQHPIVRIKRRNIARLLTALREREIEALYAAEIAELQGPPPAATEARS
ncbi:MAG TPA: 50S ribosomal protein L29 [Chloroflexia bacterium]|nr:50S ribosomal protein L29 [Chloroflexia bacterium]